MNEAPTQTMEKLGVSIALGAFLAWWAPTLYLAAAVQAARAKGHRFRLVSWLRTTPISGAGSAGDKSKHLLGWAVDLVPDPKTEEGFRTLAAQLRTWPGVWVLDHDAGSGRHLHTQIGRYPLKQTTP